MSMILWDFQDCDEKCLKMSLFGMEALMLDSYDFVTLIDVPKEVM